MFCNTRYLISILFVTACVYSTKQEDVSSGKDVEVTINNDTEEVSSGKKGAIDIVSGPTHLSHSNLSVIPPPPVTTPTTPNITTTVPTPTTVKPNSTTTETPTTSTPTTTTEKPTTTVKPNSTTTEKPTPTTVKPNSTTTEKPTKPTTLNPTTAASSTAKPSPDPEPSRKFDGPSFVGGIVLALGLVGIGFVAFKFYKARLEVNYHTL